MVFLTIVTYNRKSIFTTEHGRRLLRLSIETVRQIRPFELFAAVLLPDHWHVVMRLPGNDADYSRRIGRIKEEFTASWLAEGLPEAEVTASQRSRGERGVWQPRFWEHTILDEDDLRRCVDYIHWNPRKHGLVKRVQDYPWSSFRRFVASGDYDIDWGGAEPRGISNSDDWGEPK
jgi:putative transposase